MVFVKQIKILAIVVLVVMAFSLILSEASLPYSDFLYKVKRLQEKTFSVLKFSPESKIDYHRFLLGRRLNELQSLVEEREYSYILSSSLRYSTTAGKLTEYIVENNLSEYVKPTQELYQNHRNVVSKLLESYPRDFNGEWKYLEDDVNYLDTYSQQLLAL